MLTDEVQRELEKRLGPGCAEAVAVWAHTVGLMGDPASPVSSMWAELTATRPSETAKKLRRVSTLAAELAGIMARPDVQSHLLPWARGTLAPSQPGPRIHEANEWRELGRFVGLLSFLDAGARAAAEGLPRRPGPREDPRAVTLVGATVQQMRAHGLKVSSAEHSKLVRVLSLLWLPLDLPGSPRDAARRYLESRAGKAKGGPGPGNGKPPAKRAASSDDPRAGKPPPGTWWGGDSPD